MDYPHHLLGYSMNGCTCVDGYSVMTCVAVLQILNAAICWQIRENLLGNQWYYVFVLLFVYSVSLNIRQMLFDVLLV